MLLVSRIPLLSASPLTLQPFTNKMAEEGPFAKHWSLAGRTYIARKVGHPITIDGDLVSAAFSKWYDTLGQPGAKVVWNQDKPWKCDDCCKP